MKRALKVVDGKVVTHRPYNEELLDDSWIVIEWAKSELEGKSFNELIQKEALSVVDGKIKIDTVAVNKEIVRAESRNVIEDLEKRVESLERAIAALANPGRKGI